MFKKQSIASFEEASAEFEASCAVMKGKCFWLNEIGIMAVSGDVRAEKLLLTILETSSDEICKKIAYSFLTDAITAPTAETTAFIERFNGDETNTVFIEDVKQQNARRAQQQQKQQ
jgi:hypothetical protein